LVSSLFVAEQALDYGLVQKLVGLVLRIGSGEINTFAISFYATRGQLDLTLVRLAVLQLLNVLAVE